MKDIIKTITVLFLLFNFSDVNAQTKNEFLQEWDQVASYENKGLTQDAQNKVAQIFDQALVVASQPQQVKAVMYLMKYRNMIEENNQET